MRERNKGEERMGMSMGLYGSCSPGKLALRGVKIDLGELNFVPKSRFEDEIQKSKMKAKTTGYYV